ncbi:type I restriction endonuclease subunit R [Nocardia nova]|uniref:type I restriction endonuclease subunit R n=1 Tax=Nocardia nova TaxID=37330 RepID=UPI000CEA4F24|nr:type I restriction endonuclease [Nocardia nova]PPJ22162.1 restriction endonuclease subunit R [Nocardia nova]
MSVHSEQVFGAAIVQAMVENGWREGNSHEYRAELGLDTGELLTFISQTQQTEWDELLATYGDDQDEAQRGFAKRLGQELVAKGLVRVLREGVKDRGVLIRVAYFKPNLVGSQDVLDAYNANRLAIVRELPYATKPGASRPRLDLALLLNGIPVATAELKNPLTGQGVEEAKRQYREDRDPTELIFKHRVIANFAVDPDLVFVTTQLRAAKTVFLPFNTGSEGPGNAGGKGNPPATAEGEYATSYLWKQVWQPDNWLDLLERFVHTAETKGAGGKATRSTIFPRFHQWDVVKKLAAHAATHGSGHDYLIMASAGSGKSNTIGWLAHRLSDLHTERLENLDPEARAAGLPPGVPVFDKVIIITDRRNLDSQLRDTVGGFEQVSGLVRKIDDKAGSKSEQLAQALNSQSGKIITVTLHTFPALLDYLRREQAELADGRYAVIIDEAHSSQSGDAAAAVRTALRDMGLDADDEDQGAVEVSIDERLRRKAEARAKAANISYFAFTATPKAKTLENFGTADGAEYRPFHTYSMRQAIEEGFILDPLRNYVTYKAYYRLVNQNPDDVEVPEAKASNLLARFAFMHPYAVQQHAQVIVEHFIAHTRGRLGGRAKSMVVTASRQSAVAMARAIKEYLKDREYDIKYPDVGVLVAFSGSLEVDGVEVTEPSENGGLAESALPKAFRYTRADDRATQVGGMGQKEYRILVVAEKYQTGFDEPLLTTMYVNKTLTGIAAVQTLSRLNRTREGKSQQDLVVLDFVNEAEKIQEAFAPYYEDAFTLPTDPNLLYVARDLVTAAPILITQEMRDFAAAYLVAEQKAAGSAAKWAKLHAELYRHLAPAVDRFAVFLNSEEEDDVALAESFRANLNDYVRKYGFLAQIVPYQDPDLELLHLYGRHLLNRLPRRADGGIDIGEIDLSHLRLEQTGEHDLGLAPEGSQELRGFGDGTGPAKEPEKSLLSALVERFNERFGTEFSEEHLAVPFNAAMDEPQVEQARLANKNVDDFGVVFDKVFAEKMVEHFDTLNDLGERYFARDNEFKKDLDRQARTAAFRLLGRRHGLPEM